MSRLDDIRNHAVLALHRMTESHWPDQDGRCPVCGPDCWVLRQVGEELAPDLLGWRWGGPPGPTAATAILTRAAMPAGALPVDLVRPVATSV
ncbi:MAG TPA: hypothetical protein VFR67_06005 [Pilimelia sp.]|nr:hypothetical protein [Pilimelia sp.]